MAFQIPAEGRATREDKTWPPPMSHAISFIIIFFLIQHNKQKNTSFFFFLEGFAREVEGDKTTIGEGRSVGRSRRGEARQGKKRVEGVT